MCNLHFKFAVWMCVGKCVCCHLVNFKKLMILEHVKLGDNVSCVKINSFFLVRFCYCCLISINETNNFDKIHRKTRFFLFDLGHWLNGSVATKPLFSCYIRCNTPYTRIPFFLVAATGRIFFHLLYFMANTRNISLLFVFVFQ